jgi:hypothetical protein
MANFLYVTSVVTQILAGFPALRRQQDDGIDAIGF